MIKKYFTLYRLFFNNALSLEAQYRVDTWLKLITNIIWIITLFAIIEVVFNHTSALLGWSKAEVYILTMLWVLLDELFITLFRENFYDFSLLTAEGQLDFYLTKPVNTLFLVTTKRILARAGYRFIMQIAVLLYVLWNFDITIRISFIPLFILLLIIGLIIQYSYSLFFNIFSFWYLRIENINELIGALSMSGRYPLSILPKTLKIITFSAIPIAFSAYVPLAVLLGKMPWTVTFLALGVALSFFGLSVSFWNYAVRQYSSASS